MNHTKEPWYVVQNKKWGNADYRISNKENDNWANFGQIAYANEYDAKRIVACVNACVGITNEALEAGVVEWGVNMANDITSGDIWKDGEKVKVWEDV